VSTTSLPCVSTVDAGIIGNLLAAARQTLNSAVLPQWGCPPVRPAGRGVRRPPSLREQRPLRHTRMQAASKPQRKRAGSERTGDRSAPRKPRADDPELSPGRNRVRPTGGSIRWMRPNRLTRRPPGYESTRAGAPVRLGRQAARLLPQHSPGPSRRPKRIPDSVSFPYRNWYRRTFPITIRGPGLRQPEIGQRRRILLIWALLFTGGV